MNESLHVSPLGIILAAGFALPMAGLLTWMLRVPRPVPPEVARAMRSVGAVQTILVPILETYYSERAVELASRLGEMQRARILLGYIIEKITGESYEKFVTENLFQPLGMKDTGYDSNTRIIPRRAEGYSVSPNGYVHAGFIHMSVPHAAGALYSTTEDLLKWEQGLFGGKLLQPGSLQKMTTPFLSGYAFGLMVDTSGGRKRISHGGGIEGFNTVLEYYPEDRLTVVVLENSADATPPA